MEWWRKEGVVVEGATPHVFYFTNQNVSFLDQSIKVVVYEKVNPFIQDPKFPLTNALP